ncbi:hypothetical protein, partial [Acinetobacter baumannii]|uniref:hypothetical protein n=1 Tax=Acinetobacter baumannii TaxID=470 RepID=UPI001BC87766
VVWCGGVVWVGGGVCCLGLGGLVVWFVCCLCWGGLVVGVGWFFWCWWWGCGGGGVLFCVFVLGALWGGGVLFGFAAP